MTVVSSWVLPASILLFVTNWLYLIGMRPHIGDSGRFAPAIYVSQAAILVLLIALWAYEVLPKFDRSKWLLLGLGVALDLVIGGVFGYLPHGVYFDTVGTVLVAVILGPTAGVLTAVLSQGLLATVYPLAIPFYMISVVVGWSAGMFAQLGGFTSRFTIVVSGLISGMLAGLVAAPLMSLSLASDAAGIDETPMELLLKFGGVFFGELMYPESTSDPLDKALVFLIVSYMAPFLVRRLRLKEPVYEYRSEN